MSPEQRRPRDRAGAARAHGAVHGAARRSRSSRTGTCCCGRAAARSARAWSTRTASASSRRIVRDEIVVGFPDTRAFATEGELFGGFGGSRARDPDPPADRRHREAQRARPKPGASCSTKEFPGANVQTWPNTDAAEPELLHHRRTTADSPKPAGRAPSSAPSCARSATAPGWASTSTATSAWTSSCAARAGRRPSDLGAGPGRDAERRRAAARRARAARDADDAPRSCAASIAAARSR